MSSEAIEKAAEARWALFVDDVIRHIAELPDRTSPADDPDALLVYDGELRDALWTVIEAHAREPAREEGMVSVELLNSERRVADSLRVQLSDALNALSRLTSELDEAEHRANNERKRGDACRSFVEEADRDRKALRLELSAASATIKSHEWEIESARKSYLELNNTKVARITELEHQLSVAKCRIEELERALNLARECVWSGGDTVKVISAIDAALRSAPVTTQSVSDSAGKRE